MGISEDRKFTRSQVDELLKKPLGGLSEKSIKKVQISLKGQLKIKKLLALQEM